MYILYVDTPSSSVNTVPSYLNHHPQDYKYGQLLTVEQQQVTFLLYVSSSTFPQFQCLLQLLDFV